MLPPGMSPAAPAPQTPKQHIHPIPAGGLDKWLCYGHLQGHLQQEHGTPSPCPMAKQSPWAGDVPPELLRQQVGAAAPLQTALQTFCCLAVPYHKGPDHVPGAKELSLRVFPADAFEKPPAAETNEPGNAAGVRRAAGQDTGQEQGQLRWGARYCVGQGCAPGTDSLLCLQRVGLSDIIAGDEAFTPRRQRPRLPPFP